MKTAKEANQERVGLKMKLSNYSWYNWSMVASKNDECYILVNVKKMDNSIKKIIPVILNGVEVKVEIE